MRISAFKLLLIVTLCSCVVFAKKRKPYVPTILPPQPTSLFDGKTLEGWATANPKQAHMWSVVDGVITGGNGKDKVKQNTYLCTKKSYGDFEFRCLFRISGDPEKGLNNSGFINSGIQYRSSVNEKGRIVGYQADIGNKFWGNLYDEHRRALLMRTKPETLAMLSEVFKPDGWNSYIIRCHGKRHELYINGIKTVDYIEEADVPHEGVFGLQLHSGGTAKIEFKNITITEIK